MYIIMGRHTLKNMKKRIRKKMRRQGKLLLHSSARVVGEALRGGNPMGAIKKEVARKVDRAMSRIEGSGAYGRGAYGRGSYISEGAKTNSLFRDSSLQRHNVGSLLDETGRTCVTRREYVSRIVAPSTPEDFTNVSYSINPGLSGVFAWLSQVASNYDEYEFQQLVFSYQPVISTASTSGAMGTVVIAANYNAGAAKFSTFRQMVEYQGAIETRICDPILFGIECERQKNAGLDSEYVRTGPVPSGQDIKTYDIGLLQVATSDIDSGVFAAGTLLGHLYVEYSVILGKPKLWSALGNTIYMDMWRATVGTTDALPLGTSPVKHRDNTLGGVMSDSGTSVYTFPSNFVGTVLVKIRCEAGSMTAAPSLTAGGKVTRLTSIMGPSGAVNFETDATGADAHRIEFYHVAMGASNTLTIAGSSSAGITGSSLIITMVNPLVAYSDAVWE